MPGELVNRSDSRHTAQRRVLVPVFEARREAWKADPSLRERVVAQALASTMETMSRTQQVSHLSWQSSHVSTPQLG